MPDLFLTFNVSYRQLLYGDLVEYMEQQIKAAGIEKHRIIAELTESANPRQSDQLEHFLNGCTRLGIDVALDDFANEIDAWIIEKLKGIGCDTAKDVLAIDPADIAKRADLDDETVEDVIGILKAEFED